jgi:tetratricopeptide (TPR) repeat protein
MESRDPRTVRVIGTHVRRIRIAQGLTHAQLAERAQCSVSTISRIERSEDRGYPLFLTNGRQLVTALAVSPDAIVHPDDAAAVLQAMGAPPMEDRVVLAPSPGPNTLPPLTNCPRLPNPDFCGRHHLLLALQAAWRSGMPAKHIQVLQGLGGTGKTQLAVEYAYRFASPQQYAVVWWVQAEAPTTLVTDYTALARALRLPEAARESPEVVAAVRRWLEQRADWLLIFDNVRRPADVQEYLPRGAPGHVLITTTNLTWEGLGTVVPVGGFERDEAVQFLTQRTQQADREAASALAAALGYLPLALAQSGAYIAARGLPLADYLALFHQRRRDLWQHERPPPNYPDTVATTWSLALEQIRAQSPEGATLLTLCAYLGPEAIPRMLFRHWGESRPPALAAALADPFVLGEAIATLRQYALVEVCPEEGLSVHRLVQLVVRDSVKTDDARKTWGEVAVRLVAHGFPAEADMLADMRTWPVCARLLPHALAAAAHAEALRAAADTTATLWHQVGRYLHGQAQFTAARTAFERAQAIQEQTLGAQHSAVAHSLNNLAELCESQGQYTQAGQLAQRALGLLDLRSGAEQPERAESLYILGMVAEAQGQYAAAARHYQQALEIRQRLFRDESWQVAQCLNNLGMVAHAQGQYTQAVAWHQRALAIRRRVLASDHPDIAQSLHNLALLYGEQGQYAQAVRHCQEALDLWQHTLGAEHPDVAFGCNTLGGLAAAQGHYQQAQALYIRARTIWEEALGPQHPNVAGSLNNLALLSLKQGHLTQAAPLLQRAIRIWETTLGPETPEVAQGYNNLALLSLKQGHLTQAARRLQWAIRIWETTLGSRHPQVAHGYYNLARLYGRQGQEADAQPLLRQAIDIWETTLGSRHPLTMQAVQYDAVLTGAQPTPRSTPP